MIERAGVYLCLDVLNDGYRNVLVLLSKKGNEGASDQVFMVLGFGHFALIASDKGVLFLDAIYDACAHESDVSVVRSRNRRVNAL
jgi:hypothetical protein